ncbi:alpha-amylase family protein [Spirosoma aureum]|uniref:hypothetical protein n=1 Tax=Spirosoma aureum TaxID=2692134 RepID=UPI0018D62E39|nr:hypothetical protein [Spirosoma aureum]
MNDTENSRRSFLKNTSAGTTFLATSSPFVTLDALTRQTIHSDTKVLPWYKTVTRWRQVNITEKDPLHYAIGWWRNYWKRTELGGIIVNAGGIVAYYPNRIPFHHKAEYLGDRDLFGELCKGAHEDGLAVFIRMDSNRAHEDFYKAHPGWFAIDGQGKPYKSDDLYISCIFSLYYQEHIPAILAV